MIEAVKNENCRSDKETSGPKSEKEKTRMKSFHQKQPMALSSRPRLR